MTTFEGHEAPILSIGIDPHGDILASTSCDGTFRIWNTSDQSQLHQEKLWPRSADVNFSKARGTCLFEPKTGDLIAIQAVDEIKIVQRSDYAVFHSIDEPKVKCIAWSDDGLLLASGAEKTIKIYNSKSWMPEKEITLQSACQAIAFDNDRLLIGEESGHVTILSDFSKIKQNVRGAEVSTKKAESQSEMEVDEESNDSNVKRPAFVDDEAGEDDDEADADDLEGLWDGDDEPVPEAEQNDESNAADISLEAIKKQTRFDQDSEKGSELGDDFDADGNQISKVRFSISEITLLFKSGDR